MWEGSKARRPNWTWKWTSLKANEKDSHTKNQPGHPCPRVFQTGGGSELSNPAGVTKDLVIIGVSGRPRRCLSMYLANKYMRPMSPLVPETSPEELFKVPVPDHWPSDRSRCQVSMRSAVLAGRPWLTDGANGADIHRSRKNWNTRYHHGSPLHDHQCPTGLSKRNRQLDREYR